MDLYKADNRLHFLELSNAEHRVLSIIKWYVNRERWGPAAIPESAFRRVMSKNTFLAARQKLIHAGHITMTAGRWKTDAPVYNIFTTEPYKTETIVRTEDEIREIVKDIDRQHPDFSRYCAKNSWDTAIRKFRAAHPELGVWGIDSIGDPDNRLFAHERFRWLHNRKTELPAGAESIQPRPLKPASAWESFYLFVDLWRLTYPKKAGRAAIMKAVKDFIKGKEQWTPEHVKALQDTITNHTAAYVASFGGDYTYMVSPVNYFAAEKWTEKVSAKRDKNDVHYKNAGAHAIRNMPKITTIRVN